MASKSRNYMTGKIFILLFTILLLMTLDLHGENFKYDYVLWRNEPIPIPQAYTVVHVIRYLGETVGLNEAQDLFVDSSDNLYVADTGNDRIVKLNANWELAGIFKGEEKGMKSPKGVFVDKFGDILIADTQNERILHLSPEGKFVEEFISPTSDLLGDYFTFTPTKLYLSPTGYLYVLRGRVIMTLDAGNNFRGYLGQSHVGFSFNSWLINFFATEEQKDRIAQRQAASYTNITMDQDGFIYATSLEESKSQIKKLNVVGENIYIEQFFGERTYDEVGDIVFPEFVDVTVQKNGIVSALEKNQCKIYQYDQEGNLLAVFGGKGDKEGRFIMPTSITHDSQGRLYVLDSNMIQVLEPTQFIIDVHRAVHLYSQGKYSESHKEWLKVKKVDENYPLASRGIAKLLYKQGEFKEALASYRSGQDKAGYSLVFSEYRHDLFRKYFPVVVLGLVLILVFLVFVVQGLKFLSNWAVEEALKNRPRNDQNNPQNEPLKSAESKNWAKFEEKKKHKDNILEGVR